MEYGLFNFTDEYYRSIDAINVSSLKELRKSGKHYWKALYGPKEKKEAFDFGTAFHWAVLEPDKFAKEVFVKPKFSGTGSRAESKRWEEDHQDKVTISKSSHTQIRAMAEVVKAHPMFKWAMDHDNKVEQTCIWKDPITGQNCKGKLDLIVRDGNYHVVDLKSTLDASYSGFKQSVASYGYFVQAAFYLDAIERTTGNAGKFHFLSVEKADPHGVGFYTCSDQMIEFGRQIYQSLLKKALKIKKDRNWGDYDQREMFVSEYTMARWAADCGVES